VDVMDGPARTTGAAAFRISLRDRLESAIHADRCSFIPVTESADGMLQNGAGHAESYNWHSL